MIGTGTNNIDKVIAATRGASGLGANAALIVTPYYSRPTQEGLFRFYAKVASEVDIPIVLYNVPSRTGVNLLPETVLRLSEIPNIVCVKEASGNLGQVEAICAGGFPLLSGDDGLTYPILTLGGAGVISVIANLLPKEMARMCSAWKEGDRETALSIHRRLTPLMKALFIEPSPVPLKAALRMAGRGTGEVRLPLAPLPEEKEPILREAMEGLGIL
jgi:4-hydroxy-tetrahydrodipicolinate synthase